MEELVFLILFSSDYEIIKRLIWYLNGLKQQ